MVEIGGGSKSNGAGANIYAANDTAAQRWRILGVGDGYYRIVNVNSGKVLDVAGASRRNGTVVQQYAWNGSNAQKWQLVNTGSGYKFVSALGSSYVLDLAAASTANGTRVQLYRWNGSKAQLWGLTQITQTVADGYYTVTNERSGKVLDVSGASLEDGANVQQYTANSSLAQTFRITWSSDSGYYVVTNAASGKVLDVSGGQDANRTNIQQYAPNSSAAQCWVIVKASDGTYTFRSALGGKLMEVAGGSKNAGGNVQLYQANGTYAQKWELTANANWLPSGAYQLVASNKHTNNVAAVSAYSGANVAIATRSSSSMLNRWYLASAGDGYYTLWNMNGHYAMDVVGGAAANGTNVQEYSGNTSSAQLWMPELTPGGIVFHSKLSNSMVLDIAGGSTRDGANVQLYSSNGTAAQRFLAVPVDAIADGAYTIASFLNTAKVLDIPAASKDNGAQLQIYDSNLSTAQQFKVTKLSNGSYTITAVVSNKVLDVAGATLNWKTGAGTVQQYTSNGSAAQMWDIVVNADGTLTFFTKCDATGKACLDVSSASTANATKVGVYNANGTNAQKFVISTVAGTAYRQLSITLARMASLQGGDYESVLNALTTGNGSYYKFLDLKQGMGATAAQLNAFINSTASGRSGILANLGSAFASAASTYGINEVYLLSHAILESGWGTSTLAKGQYYDGSTTIDNQKYAAGTYYSFFGIGAYDDSADWSGLNLAVQQGWNTPAKAVAGAAQWIADNFVYEKTYAQDTLYSMKWDYARTDATGARGWHQYATSLTWADSIGDLVGQCLAYNGLSGTSMSFIVPVYK